MLASYGSNSHTTIPVQGLKVQRKPFLPLMTYDKALVRVRDE